jgi:hypothetical protein
MRWVLLSTVTVTLAVAAPPRRDGDQRQRCRNHPETHHQAPYKPIFGTIAAKI